MKETIVDIITIKISIKHQDKYLKNYFISKNEFIKFNGYLEAYLFQQQDKKENNTINLEHLKQLKKDTEVEFIEIKAEEKYSKPSHSRYTEASIIKKLDDGIGRPSTYATIISNIQDRKYIVKKTLEGKEKECLNLILNKDKELKETKKIKIGGEKDKLVPTEIGNIVNDFLLNNFSEILNNEFTAECEKEFDKIG